MAKIWIILPVVVFCTLLGAAGAILLKKAGSRLSLNPLRLMRNFNLIAGFSLYVLASIIFIYVLKLGELSAIYPLTSLSYVWVAIASARLLKERLTTGKLLGIGMVIIGVVLLTLK